MVQAVPSPIKQPIKDILTNARTRFFSAMGGMQTTSAGAHYTMVALAKLIGVAPMFLRRADAIFRRRNSAQGSIQFLYFYVQLAIGVAPKANLFSVGMFLETEEEVLETQRLLEGALQNARSRAQETRLKEILLCLKNVDVAEPELVALVHSIVGSAIEELNKTRVSKSESAALEKYSADVLRKIYNIFEHHGKRYFLLSGTLLGLERIGGVIPGDLDIDLAVFSDEVSKSELKSMFSDTDFYVDRDYEHEVSFRSSKGLLVEFFLCEKMPGGVIVRSYADTHHWHFSSFNLVESNYLGVPCLIPGDTKQFLSENYGNWQDPVVFFEWAYDTPCCELQDNLEAALFQATTFRNAMITADRHIATESARLLQDKFGVEHTSVFPHKVNS